MSAHTSPTEGSSSGSCSRGPRTPNWCGTAVAGIPTLRVAARHAACFDLMRWWGWSNRPPSTSGPQSRRTPTSWKMQHPCSDHHSLARQYANRIAVHVVCDVPRALNLIDRRVCRSVHDHPRLHLTHNRREPLRLAHIDRRAVERRDFAQRPQRALQLPVSLSG